MYSILPFVDHSFYHHPISLFAIFDGHGGPRVANFASNRLPQLFLSSYKELHDVQTALESAFLATDRELMTRVLVKRARGEQHQPANFRRVSSGSEFGSLAFGEGLSRSGSVALGRCLSGYMASRGVNTVEEGEEEGEGEEEREEEEEEMEATDAMTPWAPRHARMDAAQCVFGRTRSRAEESLSGVAVKMTRGCGSTATVVALIGSELWVAHVGDSRAVLGGSGGFVLRLCEDHRPSREDEMRRIEDAGGLVVEVSGTCRVNGVLGVSRALGDVELKDFVIARPEVRKRGLCGDEEFLVVASDGLWDWVSDEECVRMVKDAVGDKEEEEGGEERAAKNLVQCAWDRGSNDDVSVIVVNLCKYSEVWRDGYGTEEEDGFVVDEVCEEIDVDRVKRVTPLAYDLETPRIKKNSHW